MSSEAFDDARALLDNYIETTKGIQRCFGEEKPYFYPQGTLEMDMLVFAAVFTSVWQGMGTEKLFSQHYASKPRAFEEMVNIATPEAEFHPYTCFWEQDGSDLKKVDVATEAGARSLCRTLRNGFNHFNYRYVDKNPDAYFSKLGVATPSGIRDPQTAVNYRIFICDHQTKDKKNKPLKLMDSGSNTRILETGFAHIRFHLYAFLEQFFKVECGRPEVSLMDLGRS